MNTKETSIRDQVHHLADQLPADATWRDVVEQARFRQAVDEGIAAADRVEFASDEEVRRVFARYGCEE